MRKDRVSEREVLGSEFGVSEPAGTSKTISHGGDIADWEAIEKIEKVKIRRGITMVVLASLPLLVVGAVVGGVLGMNGYIVAALGMVVAAALAPVLRYYF